MRLFLFFFAYIHAWNKLKMRVLERNASDGVNPIILIRFGSLYLTRLHKTYVRKTSFSTFHSIKKQEKTVVHDEDDS